MRLLLGQRPAGLLHWLLGHPRLHEQRPQAGRQAGRQAAGTLMSLIHSFIQLVKPGFTNCLLLPMGSLLLLLLPLVLRIE
jgi:hypothetical protein